MRPERTFLSRRLIGADGVPTPLSPLNTRWPVVSRSRVSVATLSQKVINLDRKPISPSVAQRFRICVALSGAIDTGETQQLRDVSLSGCAHDPSPSMLRKASECSLIAGGWGSHARGLRQFRWRRRLQSPCPSLSGKCARAFALQVRSQLRLVLRLRHPWSFHKELRLCRRASWARSAAALDWCFAQVAGDSQNLSPSILLLVKSFFSVPPFESCGRILTGRRALLLRGRTLRGRCGSALAAEPRLPPASRGKDRRITTTPAIAASNLPIRIPHNSSEPTPNFAPISMRGNYD